MSTDARTALFERDGDRFVPGECALGPWSADALHGGPVSALLATQCAAAAGDDALQITRMTVDLFRNVPRAPLTVPVREVRRGRRIVVLEASVVAGDTEVARASALLLQQRPDLPLVPADPPPPGPEGYPTEGLFARGLPAGMAAPPRLLEPGFHSTVEARWVVDADRDEAMPVLWLRAPLPLIAGEPIVPVARAAAVADYANALANILRRRQPDVMPFINTDITLYLHRPPEGEWIAMRADQAGESHGIGVSEASQFDVRGRIGHAVVARLANPAG